MTSPTSDPIADFDHVSTENFDGEDVQIGWVEYSSCTEGWNPSTYNAEYTMEELLDLAQYAITMKILPSTDVPGSSENADFAVMADMCSAPVQSLNNGYMVSHFQDGGREGQASNNWIGSSVAVARMRTQCASITAIENRFYWACGNVDGLYCTFRCKVFVRCHARRHRYCSATRSM